MFFIYSVDITNLSVNIHNYTKDSSKIEECLDHAAKNFIKHEQGERAAESPYRDNVSDTEITDDGYFLRKNIDHPNQIDVFHRKTKVQSGYVYNSYDVEIKKVLHFGVSENNIDFGENVSIASSPVNLPPPPPPPMPTMPYFDDLKNRLAIQREKLDMNLVDSDSDSDTDFEFDEANSLLNKLRKKAELTIDVPKTQFDNFTLAYKPYTMDRPILDFSNYPSINYHPLYDQPIDPTDFPNLNTPVSAQSPIDFSNLDWGEQTKAINYPFNK